MRRSIGWIVLLCAVLATTTAAPADEEPTVEPRKVVETFLKGIVDGDIGAAYDALMQHSKLDELKPRESALAKTQVQQASIYGQALAYEYLSDQMFGSSLRRLVYITKHRDTPLVWHFVFYKAESDWSLHSFKFNDDVGALH